MYLKQELKYSGQRKNYKPEREFQGSPDNSRCVGKRPTVSVTCPITGPGHKLMPGLKFFEQSLSYLLRQYPVNKGIPYEFFPSLVCCQCFEVFNACK